LQQGQVICRQQQQLMAMGVVESQTLLLPLLLGPVLAAWGLSTVLQGLHHACLPLGV
jgi:hypothetical protein